MLVFGKAFPGLLYVYMGYNLSYTILYCYGYTIVHVEIETIRAVVIGLQ
jgi:hypothetical protein